MTISAELRKLFLPEHPSEEFEGGFLKIHEGIGGWNSGLWYFADMNEDGDCPDLAGRKYLECWQTGYTNTSYSSAPPTREAAIDEALHWAQMEDLPVWIPGVTDKED